MAAAARSLSQLCAFLLYDCKRANSSVTLGFLSCDSGPTWGSPLSGQVRPRAWRHRGLQSGSPYTASLRQCSLVTSAQSCCSPQSAIPLRQKRPRLSPQNFISQLQFAVPTEVAVGCHCFVQISLLTDSRFPSPSSSPRYQGSRVTWTKVVVQTYGTCATGHAGSTFLPGEPSCPSSHVLDIQV